MRVDKHAIKSRTKVYNGIKEVNNTFRTIFGFSVKQQ